MEETLATIEFLIDGKKYVARLQSEMGGLREYKGNTLEEVLTQVMLEIQDEFEGETEL